VLTLNLGGGCARDRERGVLDPLPLQPSSVTILPGSPTVTVLVDFSGVAHGAMPVTVRGYVRPGGRQATQRSRRKCYHGQATRNKSKRSGRKRVGTDPQVRHCINEGSTEHTHKIRLLMHGNPLPYLL
jgi:hypothetical protein